MKVKNIYPVYESEEESRERFLRIYELTNDIVGPENVLPMYPDDIVQCWKSIAEYWSNFVSLLGGIDLMYEAIYHVRYRVFSDNVNATNELRLVLLIEDELCRCGYAFHAWNNMREFETVYRELLVPHKGSRGWKQYCPESLERYLAGNMANRIMLKERPPLEWGSELDCERATFPYEPYYLAEHMEKYECAISLLLPESSQWYEEWTDGQYAVECIKKQYGIDFTNDEVGYNNLLALADTRNTVKYCAYALYRLENVTPELTNVLWGEDSYEMLQRCFLDIYKRYKVARKNPIRSRYSRQAVMQSWLYQWVDQNHTRKETKLDNKVRDAYLRIAMGI